MPTSTSTPNILIMEISKSSRMYRRNLLICFDAFGTLFKPRRPVEQQYAEVARSFGLRGFSDEDVKASFRTGEFKYFEKFLERALLRSTLYSVQERGETEPEFWES